ncbi:MAG: type VI secretion system protein TssA [Janthinobacterium lividum]
MIDHDDVYPAALIAELAAACDPLADNAPAGPSLRYTSIYQDIRRAREEDDVSLPRGDWERPLKRADWPKVASLCVNALRTKSKDFQIAGWLCEAWVHIHGLPGLCAAIDVFSRLADGNWNDAHPVSDGDDLEPRIGIFAWVNESLASTLTLDVPLMRLDLPGMTVLNLDGWTRYVGSAPLTREEDAPTRDELIAHASAGRLERLFVMQRELAHAAAGFASFAQQLDHAMHGQAPSFERTSQALERLGRAIASLVDGRQPVRGPTADTADASSPPSENTVFAANSPSGTSPLLPGAPGSASSGGPHSGETRIRDRDHAYEIIAAVAGYLQRHEPHSPTPYLLLRAVSWGRMPLIALMGDIVREESDLQRYLAAIGARP